MESKAPLPPFSRDRRRRRLGGWVVFAASLVAGCQTPPPAAPPSPAPTPPAPEVEAAPPPPPPTPAPAGPAAQQQAQKAALAAADLLEAGNDDAARAELKRSLGLDGQNKLAQNLSRQLSADPVATLGKESFNYTVRPNETMSKIAGRFLNDLYAFVLLARYNGIAVPKQVAVGQVLKIPGKPRPGVAPPAVVARAESPPAAAPVPAAPAPAKAASPAPPSPPAPAPPPPPPPELTPAEKALRSAQAAERNGDLATARLDYISAANLGQTTASAKADQLGRTLVQRYSAAARGALARQELDASIANWQHVLDIEPNNATARSEIERMRGLKQKLGSLK